MTDGSPGGITEGHPSGEAGSSARREDKRGDGKRRARPRATCNVKILFLHRGRTRDACSFPSCMARATTHVTSAAPPPDSTPDPGGITTRRRRCRRARSPSPGRRAGSFGASRAWRSREGARGGARGSPPGACRRRAWRVDGAWRCAGRGLTSASHARLSVTAPRNSAGGPGFAGPAFRDARAPEVTAR